MTKMSEPIVFFGSGPVAAESLALLANDFTIEAIITKPRAIHHKGDVPVLSLAETLGIPVRTAANKQELNQLFKDAQFSSRVAVLIDFGIIVSQDVIDYFPLGIVNSHFSILPEWRGADPITFAILSGQKQTGVSLMLLVEAMDEGPLLGYGEYDLTERLTTPQLTGELIKLSHELLRYNLPKYVAGNIRTTPQDVTGRAVSYSRKLSKDDGRIDWSKPAEEIEQEIRGFAGWPKSRAHVGALDVIIVSAQVIDASGEPGERTVIDKYPVIYCGDKAIKVECIKPSGKKEMTGEAFLAGYKNQFLA